MTSSEDATAGLDDIIETPIDLTLVDKSQLLFYLATNTPLSISDLADDCTSGASRTKSILRDRFSTEINIDMTETVRLSGDARRAVIRGSKPLIKSGQKRLRRGKSHSSRDNYTEAADCFAQAVSVFQKIKECYDAVNHESPKLEKLIATTKDRHDSAANEAAKDSINYYVLHATQHESEGDKYIEKKPSRAAENYQKAANQLSQALDTAEEYNQSMWQDSSKLSLQPIKEKLSAVSEKLDSIGDISSNSSNERSDGRDDSVGKEKTSGEYDNRNLKNALQQLAMKLGESPRPEFVNKYGEYPADVYIESFGSWEDALAAANLDPIDEVERSRGMYSRLEVLDAVFDLTEELGRFPSRTEMNSKGTVSSTTVETRFEDWETALSLVKTRIGADTAEQQNEAEKQKQHENPEALTEDVAETQEVIEDQGERDKTDLYDNQTDDGSSVSPQSSASDSDREAMIEVIRTLHKRLGRVPKTTEVAEECEYVPNDFYREFGSWSQALEAAGIDKDQALLKDIRQVAEKLGHVPTTTEINKYGIYSSSYYLSNFESWDGALEQAGVEQNFGKKSEREKMLKTVKSLHERLGRAPKATELPEDCEYSRHDFYNEFGSWDGALETAGIDREQSMLDEIGRVAEKLGRVPKSADITEHGAYSSGGYSKYFDSWSEALEQAGVEQSRDSSSSSNDREAMLEVVSDLNERLGRAPKTTELPEECRFSPNDFYDEFGNWNEALEAAGVDLEESMLDEIERVAKKIGRVPNSSDMSEYGVYSSYSTYFDSWSEALKLANVEQKHTPGSSSDDREAMLEVVRDLNKRLGRAPKTTELPEECEYSRNDFYKVFGSWDETLEAAGINKKDSMLAEIERVAEKLGRVPNSSDMSEYGAYSSYSTYFGSWDAALTAADLSIDTTTRKEQNRAETADGTAKLAPSTPIENIMSHVDSVGLRNISRLENAGFTTLGELCDMDPRAAADQSGIERTLAIELVRFATENVSKPQTDLADRRKSEQTDTPSSEGKNSPGVKPDGSATLDATTGVDIVEDYVDGVGPIMIHLLKKADYTTLGELSNANPKEITVFDGITRTTALNLIGFAKENVSDKELSSGQSSDGRSSTDQSSSPTQGSNSNQIQPSALETSWETIPANERINEQFLIQVTDVDQQNGGRKTARLGVQDQNGRKFKMNIWSKHGIDLNWREGQWYALEDARGKVWEPSHGTTQKQLSSTKDLKVTELGEDFDPNVGSKKGISEPVSQPQQPGATTNEDVPESTSDARVSDRDAATTANQGESSDDTSPETDNDGILDDIMSDFDEI